MASVRTSIQGLVVAGLLAGLGQAVMAQSPAAPPPPPAERMAKHDPAKMQEHMLKRQADLKAKLKLTPAQESAWTAYAASMQPPAGMGMRHTSGQRAEMDKLTTPERIDKMRAMRAERMTQMNAEMDKRGNATKTFYAALTPEQQKVFDTEHQKRGDLGQEVGRCPGRSMARGCCTRAGWCAG